ncbi:TerB family tellurite resistance protein [Verrucomicrobiota bacterium]
MSLATLSHEQQIALTALMKAIAMANGVISEGEARGIARVAKELGDEVYRSLLDEADKRFKDIDELKRFLSGIEDTSARNLIYGTVWEESVADPDIKHIESDLLNWLKTTWNIQDKTQ